MNERRLAAYDVSWPERYARESARVTTALDAIAIEHVGSTSVPGLPAKPTIDIAAGVPTLDLEHATILRMEALGYSYGGTNGLPQHVFRKGDGAPWTHLVHVVEHDGQMWRDYLWFRDYLRANPADAEAYAALKASLLVGRDGWYRGVDKAPFIRPILARARRSDTAPA